MQYRYVLTLLSLSSYSHSICQIVIQSYGPEVVLMSISCLNLHRQECNLEKSNYFTQTETWLVVS